MTETSRYGRSDTLDISSVAADLIPIVPSDTDDIKARAVRCRFDGTGGTIRITTYDGTVRDTYITAGEILLVMVTRVHSNGTTATKLEAVI